MLPIAEIDDHIMLPIHMACRVVCMEDVLRTLLAHEGVETMVAEIIIKGRIPI